MISSPALIAKRLQRQLAEPCRPGVRPRALLRPVESSADEEITGAFTAECVQARTHGRARSLSRGPSAFCTCVQVTFKVVFKPPPAELADPETPKPAPAAVAPPLSAGDIRRDRADARLPERRCLAFENQASGPFVCSLPHGGEQGLASHWG